MRISHSLFPILGGFAIALIPAQANLLTNGDFSGGTGGTILPGSAVGGTVAVPDGWAGFATDTGALKVVSGQTVYSGGNQAIGSYIQQTITTSPSLWYMLNWEQFGNIATKTSVTTSFWNGTDTSGAADYSHEFHVLGPRQTLFKSSATALTLRLSDQGSNADTISSDTKIDNVVLDLADGLVNIAPYAKILDASSLYTSPWGNLNNAVDGGTSADSVTVFHGGAVAGGDFYSLEFDALYPIRQVEITARSGFNDRIGTTLEFLDGSGGVLATEAITSSAVFSISGTWNNVKKVRITDADSHLNLAEVRIFSPFSNGVLVPEPSSLSLLLVGWLGLRRLLGPNPAA